MDADFIVIGALYILGILSSLKAWLDHITRLGETFRYSENGPERLIKGKRCITRHLAAFTPR